MSAKIIASRLQRAVADTEFNKEFASFDELCQAVSAGQWAKSFNFDAAEIGRLIIEHDTITKVDKPVAATVPAVPVRDEQAVATKLNPVPQPPVVKLSDQPEKATMAGVSKPGKGRKECPQCKEHVGFRTAVCKCGYAFVQKTAPATVPAEDNEEEENRPETTVGAEIRRPRRMDRGGMQIAYPAGSCPHELNSTDHDAVERWAEKVRATKSDEGKWMKLSALKYYVGQFFPVMDPVFGYGADYKKVCGVLDELYTGT